MNSLALVAEVSGTVCKVEVAVGQTVNADDVVLIIEAMKMEIPVCAPHGGTIVDVFVAPEQAVEEGQTLAVLQPQSP